MVVEAMVEIAICHHICSAVVYNTGAIGQFRSIFGGLYFGEHLTHSETNTVTITSIIIIITNLLLS